MIHIGDKVLVKECQPDGVFNQIIYSDNHGNYKGVPGVVVKIIGDSQDKAILDFDRDIVFGEDMLDIVESSFSDTVNTEAKPWSPEIPRSGELPTVIAEPKAVQSMDKVVRIVETASKPDKRTYVIEKMEEFRLILEKVSDQKLFFQLYNDKLKSLLFEVYGG